MLELPLRPEAARQRRRRRRQVRRWWRRQVQTGPKGKNGVKDKSEKDRSDKIEQNKLKRKKNGGGSDNLTDSTLDTMDMLGKSGFT